MRKLIDRKEEEVINWRNKYDRLERNVTALLHKQSPASEKPFPTARTSVGSDHSSLLKNIAKPIRGGGGDVWSFKKANQEPVVLSTEPAQELPQEQLKTRVSRLKQSRSSSGFGAMFGGLLSKLM